MNRRYPEPRWMVVPFVLALLIRLPVIFAILAAPSRAIMASDCLQYLTLARNLATLGVFSLSNAPPFVAEIVRTPGYPVFLAGFLLWCPNDCAVPIVIVQAILGALIAPSVTLLGTYLLSERCGKLAGILYALAPIPAIMAGFIYAETLFAALLMAGVLLLVLYRDIRLTALSGAILGLATLSRPIGLMVIPLFAAYPLLTTPLREAWKRSLALVVGASLLILPWMGRNAYHYGVFKLSTISDINLYYYNVASAEAHRLGISLDDSRERLAEQLESWPETASRVPNAREGALARRLLWQHPLGFAWANALDAPNGLRPGFSFMFYLADHNGQASSIAQAMMQGDMAILWDQSPLLVGVALYMAGFLIVLISLSMVGIVYLLRERAWSALLLLALLPAWMLYLPGVASNARFRMPVTSFLCVLAGWGGMRAVQLIAERWGKRRQNLASRR